MRGTMKRSNTLKAMGEKHEAKFREYNRHFNTALKNLAEGRQPSREIMEQMHRESGIFYKQLDKEMKPMQQRLNEAQKRLEEASNALSRYSKEQREDKAYRTIVTSWESQRSSAYRNLKEAKAKMAYLEPALEKFRSMHKVTGMLLDAENGK